MNQRIADPSATMVTPAVLAAVGFSDHAIERFALRADVGPARRSSVEPTIRDLLLQEGIVTSRPPQWARSRNAAPRYLQVGEWMLFVLRPDERRPGRYLAVTALNGPEANTWERALRRGYVTTPPPPQLHRLPSLRVGLHDCLRQALDLRREPERPALVVAVVQAWRVLRRRARADRDAVATANRELLRRHERARALARRRHAERFDHDVPTGGRRR